MGDGAKLLILHSYRPDGEVRISSAEAGPAIAVGSTLRHAAVSGDRAHRLYFNNLGLTLTLNDVVVYKGIRVPHFERTP
jgi:hypothetical protein